MEFEKIAQFIKNKEPKTKPHFHNKNDIGRINLKEKRIEKLKEQADKSITNIHKRHRWLEAQKRKNYIHEFDRLNSYVAPILSKNPQATTINGFKERMKHLKHLAQKSIDGEKHEIYESH